MKRKRNRPHNEEIGLIEIGMAVLGLVWMVLLVIELGYGLGPLLSATFYLIWIIFIFDFLIRLFLAKRKLKYLKSNWLGGISLVFPSFRVFRIFRAIRLLRIASVTRGISFVRLISSFRRSARALGNTMGRHGFAYVVVVTVVVTFLGAAGMYTFETNIPGQEDGFTSYWDALWWTGMLLTTIASQYWPVTAEGRILSLILSIYALSVFGYIAAVLASYFVGSDVSKSKQAEELQRLETAVSELGRDIRKLNKEKKPDPPQR